MTRELTHKEKKELEIYRKEAINVAKDFELDNSVIDKINKAS